MRVAVIRHHEQDTPGFIADAFRARGAQLSMHLVPGGPLPDLDGLDHLVMLGAIPSLYDASVPWIRPELDWLRQVDEAGVPILGICYGVQELSALFGGQVVRAPRMEIGWTTIETADPELIPAGPWLEFHGDMCLPPASARVLARSEIAVQALSVGRHLGVQFHPEVDGAQLKLWLDVGGRDEAIRAGVDPDQLLADTIAQEPAARQRADHLVATALTLAAAGAA
jgi:GMP synthase-like glutamine amidotransferase